MDVILKDNTFVIQIANMEKEFIEDKLKDEARQIAETITDYVNSFSRKEKYFCEAMSNQHRTLQQSFTRLCLQWLEYCASEEYRTDGRNEGSKIVAQKLCTLWLENKKNDFDGLPSQYVPLI